LANIVAIVGRPNVGKSTLFNRLIEMKRAIMDNESGVTRDRHYGYAEWIGKYFTVIDTGGYVTGSDDIFEEAIRTQVKEALEEATVILFMVDVKTGLTGMDSDFANVLREVNKPILLVANKADNQERLFASNEFYSLGIGEEMFPIASISGSGTGELLDKVVTYFDDEGINDPYQDTPKIAILGRPNVGKSSFLNALLGRERTIVTDIAGTTRDSINTHYKLYGKDFILTDTAGIRKKSRVKEDIEFYSVLRSIQALQDSDVCMIILDAERGLESQDMSIIALAHKYNKGIMIMYNKWDLMAKDSKTADKLRKEIADKLGPMSYIPVIFTSVIEKQRIFQSIEMAMKIYESRTGKYIRIKYVTQIPGHSPAFAFFCNLPQYIQESYERYLTNRLREHFDFEGVPIRIFFRKK